MDARPGDVLAGKFRVERRIGAGGMGTVIEAFDTVLNRRVAIKLANDALAADPSAAARFLREARAMAALRGGGFVRVFEVGQLEGSQTPFLVMELLDGEDLKQRLNRTGPLPQGDLIEYVAQACEALAEAHAVGLVHRDIKPSNLFVEQRADGRPHLRVLDFGISKPGEDHQAEALTASSGTLGSPRYMSPEQALDPRDVDARSDVWSLGVTIYELWTGRPPFAGTSHLRLCKAILESEPVPPSTLRSETPPAFERVILRCLCKKPQDRFADVAALAESLALIDTRASQRAISARAFIERSSSSRRSGEATAPTAPDGDATDVDHPGTKDATATSVPVSHSSPSLATTPPSRRSLLALGVVTTLVVAGVLVRFALLDDAGEVSVRAPAKLVGTPRPLVNEAVASRSVSPAVSATTAATPKVRPVATRTSTDDDPLGSSH